MRAAPASVAGVWRASHWHRQRRGVRLEPVRGEESISARAPFKREPHRFRAWRRVGLGRSHRIYGWIQRRHPAMLLDSIGGIFDPNFSNSLARFLVPDIGIDQAELRVVLLVESPHTHEVCHHYPLAGPRKTDAGRIVGDKLRECRQALQLPEQAIGRLVLQGHDAVQALGIMNVGQLPFQETAYDCTPWAENDCRDRGDEWEDYIDYMNTIVGNPGARRRVHARCLQLDKAIATDLKRRLRILHGRSPCVLLVRCGRVAKKFHEKTGIELHTCDLPHPTNRGSGGELWEELNCDDPPLQGIINRLWPNPT